MATQLSERTGTRFAMRCWGDFAIADIAGADMRPRGRKARALLAYLAMHPDKRVSREKLTALLWSDRGEEQARASLRQSLFELKPFANGAGLLTVERDTVTLNAAVLATDIAEIQELAAGGDHDALLGALPDSDETVFAGLEGLAEGFDEWLHVERARQRDALVTLIGDASADAIACGRTRPARALHARLLELEPEWARPAPAPVAVPQPPIAGSAAAAPASPARRRWLIGAGATAVAAVGGAWWLGRSDGPGAEVRSLTESANAIIYQRKFASMATATELLRRAVALDPSHAPAWAGLAAATAMSVRTPEGLADAERQARRAIALDPTLGKAHGVLGMVLGFDSGEARAAIRKAVALDPNDAETLFWLSNVEQVEGNFVARLEALRRAARVDPMWHRSSGTAALAAYELGYPDEARAHIDRVRRADLRAAFLCAYSVDWASGAYAEVVRAIVAARPQLSQADGANWKLGNALLILGHVEPARLLLRMPPELWEVARGGPPSAAGFVLINREAELTPNHDFCFDTGLRQLLRAGRGGEAATLYDRREGRAGAFADAPSASTLLEGGVDMALALHQGGRTEATARLLDRTETAMRRAYRQGLVPNWLDANAAQLHAVRGREEDAIASLKRALDRGWHYAPVSPLPDLAEVPAFTPLAGHPDFEVLRVRERAHLDQERRALGPVPV